MSAAPISRLFLEVKGVFHTFGWLAKMGQGIEDHVIVSRFALSADEGLSVDFALKNTAMHYLQTVDFRSAHHATQRRTEAQAKALALGLGEQLIQHPLHAQRYFVVAGVGEPDAKRTIKMAERVCEHVFAHESRQDMDELMSILGRAMGRASVGATRNDLSARVAGFASTCPATSRSGAAGRRLAIFRSVSCFPW